MKQQKGFYRSRLVHRSGPDREPEVDIDRILRLRAVLLKSLEAAQEELILGASGYAAENMSAATPARVEKVVQGERLE